MGPLELGVRGGGGAARRCGAPVSAAAHRRVRDRRAEGGGERHALEPARRSTTVETLSYGRGAQRPVVPGVLRTPDG